LFQQAEQHQLQIVAGDFAAASEAAPVAAEAVGVAAAVGGTGNPVATRTGVSLVVMVGVVMTRVVTVTVVMAVVMVAEMTVVTAVMGVVAGSILGHE